MPEWRMMENSEKTGERGKMRTTTTKKDVFVLICRKETEPDSSFVTPNFMDEKRSSDRDRFLKFSFFFFSFYSI